MATKRVLVLGRFQGGVRQRDIRAQLRAQGHRPTGLVRRAEVVIAGSRCGSRLDEARAAGLTVLDQAGMAALTDPPPAQSAAKRAAKPAAKPAARPRPVVPRAPTAPPEEAIRQIAAAPMGENSWWQLGQLLKLVPEASLAGLVDEIAEPVCAWPAHIRGAHTEWLLSLLDGPVDPRLRLVGQLYLSDVIKKDIGQAAAVLDRCTEHLPGVRQLRINHFQGGNDWQRLITPERLAPFSELDLMYNKLGVAGLERILSAVEPSRITLLDLRSNDLGEAGMRLLADAGLSSLRWLHLYQNNIGNKGLEHLTTCPALSGLSYLSVEYNHLKSAAGKLLAKATFAPSLTGLKVKYNDLLAAGGKALAAAKTLGNLRMLDISANEIGDEALAAMAGSPHLGALEELRCEGNAGNRPLLTDSGMIALAEGTGMPRLGVLKIQCNEVTGAGLSVLLRSKNRSALHTLDINNNNIPCDESDVLLQADLPVRLRGLTIGFSDGNLQTFKKILRNAASFASLEQLVIRPSWKAENNPAITDAILENPHLEGIADLELRNLWFSDKTLGLLMGRELPNLTRLNLSSPGFNDAMLKTFMSTPWLHRLEKLVVYCYPDKPDYTALKAMFEGTATVCVAF
jgi:Leucine-rich repeat (LRR) protein